MAGEVADTIFVNCIVRTPGESASIGDALAVSDGRILRIGARADVLALGGRSTEIVDAAGGTLLPAFTDSHTHFKRASLAMEHFIDFEAVAPGAVADVCDAVGSRAATLPAGEWVQGDSLSSGGLRERRFPTRHELDAAAPGHPVVIRSVGRHVVAANTRALELAGITRETDDPPGGKIERDSSGEPTGVLHEQAQLRLDASRDDTVVPPVTVDDRVAALSKGVGLLNRLGIAAVHEMPREPDQIGDWLRLREVEQPRVRVRFYVRGVAAQTKLEYLTGLGLRTGFGDEWIRLGGVKISIDGSCIFRNALMYKPYPGSDTNTGIMRLSEKELHDAIRQAHDNGLQIAVHAIGQKAVDLALDAFADLGDDPVRLASRRHRIEHAYLPALPGQLERIRQLGLCLSTQVSFIEAVGDSWVEIFQDERLDGALPIADALGLGIHVQLNSDYPVSSLNPFVAIKSAVTRLTRQGRALDASQAIPVETALHLMTWAPAFTSFEDSWRGRLAPGLAADLIVTAEDPVRIAPVDLDKVTVTRTMVGGRTVFVHENLT
jgi:predicted amidohydrolase YtcJ